MSQGLAALRDFGPGHVSSGSVASHQFTRQARGMSAMPAIATQLVPRNEMSRYGNCDVMHRSRQTAL